jgi:hypothetical protein
MHHLNESEHYPRVRRLSTKARSASLMRVLQPRLLRLSQSSMTDVFSYPYLGGEVQLSPEREAHIAERHPDFLPEHRDRIGMTHADPDQVRRSRRFGAAKMFSRWYSDVKGGKHVVVVVVSAGADGRHWIITAYIARKLAEGEIEWARS